MKNHSNKPNWAQEIFHFPLKLIKRFFSSEAKNQLEQEDTKEKIQEFLMEWEKVKKIRPKSVTKYPPKIWLSQAEQQAFFQDLQAEIDENFLINDFQYLEAMLYHDSNNIADSGLYKWTERNAVVNGHRLKGYEMIRYFKGAGLNLDVWYEEYRAYTRDLQKYFNKRIRYKDVSRQIHAIEAGIRGEEALVKELRKLNENYVVLQNVRVEADLTNQKSAESDVIVVSPYGVYTLESKNYAEQGEYVVNVSKSGKWTVSYTNAKGKKHQYETKDVIRQSNNHVMALKSLINSEMKTRGYLSEGQSIPVEGAIVFTNDVVEVYNYSNYPILRIKKVRRFMRSSVKKLTEDQVTHIAEILQENNLPPAKFPVVDYKKEYAHVVKNYQHMEKAMVLLQELIGYDEKTRAYYLEHQAMQYGRQKRKTAS